MLELQPHSERTSLTAQLPPGLIRADTPPDYRAEWEQRTVVCHRDVQPTGAALRMFRSETSATRGVFSTNLIFSPPVVPVFALSRPGAGYFVYRQRTKPVQQIVEFRPLVQFDTFQAKQFSTFNQTVVFQPLVEESSRATCTVEGWTLPTVFESAIHAGLSELRAIVSAIRQARPLASTPQFDELLTRAAQAHGTPQNVEEWARRVAEDVSELAD